ncbi:hypothetical protein Ssi03_77270 [Sphaerisporangium siamense]|uniref:HTTM domain-containing protein n=1 Tax=Sphaerisporangium siamense TaxID=795645 RepID=A0A7W7D5L0_9ACTN|nr:hypothetical protein [Sphaerisporangium siamense]MBB4700697.1 hypothetical protein [Sphaerisporangium siamense]GII89737.1 hypothetical protein Ssi03_77270 [Sphaerisporangium siamense]
MADRLTRWLFPEIPARRAAILRTVVYLFVPLDMVLFTGSTLAHAYSADAYRPVLVARLLHLPAANPVLVPALFAFVAVACLIAAAGRLPRTAGYAVALGFGYWAVLAMSYGKVDHDHLALIVALFVLPSAGRGSGPSERAGWPIRCVQLAVVATYFLSAYAKIRWGGWEWPNGATFQWAVSRRGTFAGEFAAGIPGLLHASQWIVLLAEALSPVLLFLRGRRLIAGVIFFAGFHLVTWMSITIHFLPHVICLGAFLPLENLRRKGGSPATAPPDRETAVPPLVEPVVETRTEPIR